MQPSAGRTYFFAQAVKGTTAADAPAAPAPTPTAPSQAPVTPAAQVPPPAPVAPVTPMVEPASTEQVLEAPAGLEALNLPKDGLSRQWLEFLSQLGATK